MPLNPTHYKVISPAGKTSNRRAIMAPPIGDLSGKTICAMRHTFRADETFAMIARLFEAKYAGIRFIPNHEMPDIGPTNSQQEAQLIKAFREKGVDVVLAGNGA